MEKAKLHEIQKAELNIFKEIDCICKELKINYWGAYGTLIGAIRHSGFIPWDDDLDLAMKRADYNLLLSYFQNNYKGPLNLHTIHTNKDYPYYIARICDDKYCFIFDDYKYHSGAFVDIYPIDGLGNTKDYWISKKNKILSLRKGMTYASSKHFFWGKSILTKIIKTPYILICKIRGKEYYYEKIDHLSQTYTWEESTYVGLPVWANNLYFHDKTDFDEFIYVPFEDTTIQIPKQYDKILTEIYGDYMKLPPKEDQKPQHGYIAYKLD